MVDTIADDRAFERAWLRATNSYAISKAGARIVWDAAIAALSASGVVVGLPAGWSVEPMDEPNDGRLLVGAASGAQVIVGPDSWKQTIAGHALFELVTTLAAAPKPSEAVDRKDFIRAMNTELWERGAGGVEPQAYPAPSVAVDWTAIGRSGEGHNADWCAGAEAAEANRGLPFTDLVIDHLQDVMAMHGFAVPVRVISESFRRTMDVTYLTDAEVKSNAEAK